MTDEERAELEDAAQDAEQRRRRVVTAFLALRDVKSIGIDPEPVVRRLRVSLLALPQLAADLELEDEETIRQILNVHVSQIIEDIEETLDAIYGRARSPALARYLLASQELWQGDLETP